MAALMACYRRGWAKVSSVHRRFYRAGGGPSKVRGVSPCTGVMSPLVQTFKKILVANRGEIACRVSEFSSLL